jgi:tetratricopeptide (TPR) repeat protein
MAIYEECFALWQTLDEPLSMAIALNNMGDVARRLGERGRARTLFEQSLKLCRDQDEPRGVARALGNLGRVACDVGDYSGAVALLEESAALYRQLGIAIHLPANRLAPATARFHLGEGERAALLLAEALALARELGVLGDTVGCLEALSRGARWRGAARRAAPVGGGAAVARECARHQRPLAERQDYEHHLASVRATLGESAFAAEWAAGRGLPLEAAIDEGYAAARTTQIVNSKMSEARTDGAWPS